MEVTPTGQSEYYEGNQIGRYGRDGSETYFIVYNDGIGGEPMWAMDMEVEFKISVSVDTFLIADHENGLYKVPRDALTSQKRVLGGREQYVVTGTHDAVEYLGDPDDHLRRQLWITPSYAHGGYHKARNES
jgi:hypothetical protein